MRKIFLFNLIFLLLFSVAYANAQTVYDFELTDLNGNMVKLSDFKGKVILLDFWATWCKPCQKAIPFLNSLHNDYGHSDFVLIGVNLDQRKSPPEVQGFLELFNAEYLNVIGSRDVMGRYKVYAMPTTVLIDRDFKEAKRFVGLPPQAEGDLRKRIEDLLGSKKQQLGVCLDVSKVAGEGSDAELGDRARRLVYKSLEDENPNLRVGFVIPGEKPQGSCDYRIDGFLTVNGSNGRLVMKLYDGGTGLVVGSASSSGELNDLELISHVHITYCS